jgi:hypothetical protein
MDNQRDVSNQRPRGITLRKVLASTVTGTWPKIVILVFIVELVVLFLGSALPLSQSTVQQINSSNNQLAQTSGSLDLMARALFLFSNNFRIALFEFVPFLGWFFFGYSMYNTALAIEVIGMSAIPPLPGPLVTLSLFFEPHSWLELPAYAIATTQSFFLISTIGRRSMFKFEVTRTGLVLVIVAVELAIAAIFESAEISLLSNLTADFVIPWAAFAVLVFLLILGRKKLLKDYKANITFQQPPIQPYGYAQQPGAPPLPPYFPSQSNANAPRFCGKCGAKISNPQSAVFCDQCGQRILQPTPGSGNTSITRESTNLPPPPPRP